VKTSLDIPEDLYRSVKVKAAQEGRKVSDLVAEGLRLVLSTTAPAAKKRLQFPLIPARPGGHVITDEMVAEAEEAILAEEAEHIASFMRR